MSTVFEAYDAILAIGALPKHAERVAEMRARFEARTGAFRPEDAWFEARSRAFWDDAITSGGFARAVSRELEPGARFWVGKLSRAHRGLFLVREEKDGVLRLRDLWSGARFFVDSVDQATKDALHAAAAPFDGRLVGADDPPRIALLPGAVFHPADAAAPIGPVLDEARSRGLNTREALDALLRMERGLRASARIKAAHAYRAVNLIPAAPRVPKAD